MEAVEAKKASFAGISGSCTADLTVTKELVAGILFRLLQYLRDIRCNVRPNFQSPVSNLRVATL